MKTQHYTVSGMACAACSATVQRVVSRLEGVTACDVNLITGGATVTFDEQRCTEADIFRVVEKAGFGITAQKQAAPAPKRTDKTALSLLIAGLFSALLLLLSMGPMLFSAFPLPAFLDMNAHPHNYALAQLLLTLPPLLVGRRFFTKGLPLLLRGHPNMDSLVAVGASTALLYSLFSMFTIDTDPHAVHHLYFESAAVVVTLVRLGKFFEEKSKKKTTEAIERLVALAPDTALVLKNGKTVTLPLSEVAVGDILLIRAGERIPLDSIVTEGHSFADESMLTGESLPVEKTVGDPLTGGSLNLDGGLQAQVTRVGEDTTLAKIIRFVEEAQSKKAPIAKAADAVAGVFVPAVMAIALVAAVVWLLLGEQPAFIFKTVTGVLVVACPCALGLATPTAVMVGTGLGAKHGILIRNGEVLETCHKVKAVVFDKTGTLTVGRPSVTDIVGDDPDQWLPLALLAESGSAHPLADAVRAYAAERGIAQPDVAVTSQTVSGKGVVCTVGDTQLLLGNAALLTDRGVTVTHTDTLEALADQGKSLLLLAQNGQMRGALAVADTLRDDAAQAVDALKAMGITTVLLSGDHRAVADYVGAQVGVDRVYADVLPEQKAAVIGDLRRTCGAVMMVGDGINDAPALAEADVGCAIGGGSDVAIGSADIVLMNDRPADVARAVRLSRLTIRNIKQNLFWAFGYNTLLIPLAAGVLYPLGILLNPMFAGLAMSLSSVFVVTNALRLRNKRL